MKLTEVVNGGQTSIFKRTIATAGALINYAGYVPLMFVVYLLYDLYISSTTGSLQAPIRTIAGWIYTLVLNPFISAGLFAGIHEQQRMDRKDSTGGFIESMYEPQRTQGKASIGGFLAGAKRTFWRIAGANLLSILVLSAGMITVLVAAGPKQSDSAAEAFSTYADIPVSAIMLFWFAALVSEGGVFRSLWRGLKALLLNPLALAIGLVWGLTRFADQSIPNALGDPGSPALLGATAAVLAVVRVLCAVYALALYKQIRGESPEPSPTETALPPSAPAGQGLIRASFGFSFAAFLPLIHLVALVLGIMALKRSKRFVLRSAIACSVGGFFTVFYLLLIAGLVVSGRAASRRPTVAFLAEANSTLAPQVALLQQGSYVEAERELESRSTSELPRPWTTDAALAIAKYGQNDLDGALDSFYAAAQGKPERSEFYFYYGLALLDYNQETMAADQFRLAATHGPKLLEAERYAGLLESAYRPSAGVSSVFFVLILLMLFTVHEYGHAFAAWKLGDDTAKNAGRLTLNPIKHLDLFGSIILPGILLWRQANMIFGWAKPVPVNPQNFKDPQKDHMRVSFAGPAVNILVSMACFIVLGCMLLVIRLFWPETLTWNIADPFSPTSLVGPPFASWLVILIAFLKQLMYTSLILGFFNLLPIPPLDGSWILSGFLPQGLRTVFEQTRRFGFVLFLLVAVTPIIDYYLSVPLGLVWGGLQLFASTLGLG